MISPYLGVRLDQTLSMSSHISDVCRSSFLSLGHIGCIRPYLYDRATSCLVNSIVTSRLDFCNLSLTGITADQLNPFLSVHIPYVQSEGILPQIRLLQWRAYIFRNTQCFSTKLGRNMVNALFCHKTLKYWWPLTYIQGHVIQDGCQIQSEKSILGQKIAITRPIFWQIW